MKLFIIFLAYTRRIIIQNRKKEGNNMENRKLKAIAKIERDAQNFFFVKMLYGYENEGEPQTIYGIEDSSLKEDLISLSYMALKEFPICRDFGYSIIIYNPENGYCYYDNWANYEMSSKIIVGTVPKNYFDEINYLIRMISKTMERNNIGECWIQYKDKMMKEEEFYEFQNELSIYTV